MVSFLLDFLFKTTQIFPHQQSFKVLSYRKRFLKVLKILIQNNLLLLKHFLLFKNMNAAYEHPPRTKTITKAALPLLAQISLLIVD
jgi:hypothetical protein